MDLKKHTIIFTLVYSGEAYRVHTYENQYHSLMKLISARVGIINFGLCSGMGSCGTCFVEMYEKVHGSKKTVLSCGIKIDDQLSNIDIRVSESFY